MTYLELIHDKCICSFLPWYKIANCMSTLVGCIEWICTNNNLWVNNGFDSEQLKNIKGVKQ